MYHYKGSLTIGQVNRFIIEVRHDPLSQHVDGDHLAVRVKNTTSALMRPNLLAGPYIIYTSIREQSYDKDTALGKGDFAPHFDPNVKTNCSRWQLIPICAPKDKNLDVRTFELDVISQIIFSPSATAYFEVSIGHDKEDARKAAKAGHPIEAHTPGFNVRMQDTETLWGMPSIPRDHPGHRVSHKLPPSVTHSIRADPDGIEPDHLVVLTHGIHANLTSDMLYLKEVIEKQAKKNGQRVICKGFANNSSNTERGVKWLAENVGEWVLRELGWRYDTKEAVRDSNPYKKISFISHSLGGLVQIYVVGYLHDRTRGKIFLPHEGGVDPINFVTLASPWLGISAENPAYVKLALDFGLIGKTGQDLALTPKPLGEYMMHAGTDREDELSIVRSKAPLLSLLSRVKSPSHMAIRLFKSRTIYANIENDGIVPLRTSSLFFLDWKGFSREKAQAQQKSEENKDSSNQPVRHDMDGSTPDRQKSASADDSNPDVLEKEEESDSSEDETSKPANPARLVTDADQMNACTGQSSEQPTPSQSSTAEVSSARETPVTDGQEIAGEKMSHRSPMRSLAHALNFTSLVRRSSNSHMSPKTSGSAVSSPTSVVLNEDDSRAGDHNKQQPGDDDSTKASGPSDEVENASHANGGILGLLRPNQSHRKASKAFARTQTKSDPQDDDDTMANPEMPSPVGFFKSLESVLNPPMPASDYLTDPASREPVEAVIVHDRFYSPKDIPPLKELQRRTPNKHQSRSAKKAEDHERVRLEKIKLEEKIARGWHADMVWRKVLVNLPPDAHNNIIVRRAFANSHGWHVVDHLAEHHFGASANGNEEIHDRGTQKSQTDDWETYSLVEEAESLESS